MPVVGPAAMPASIVRIAIHYTAAANLSDGDAGEKAGDVPAYLRAIHRDYTVNRGYSVGYSFAADAYGQAWELRGLDIKCAANKGMNDTTYAILCIVDGNDAANPPMVGAVREIVSAIYAHLGRIVPIVGHRDIGATACPGTGLYAQIQDRTFVPIAPPPEPPPTEESEVRYVVLQATGRPELLTAMDGAGITVVGFASPSDRDTLIKAFNATACPVSPGQFDEFVARAGS